MSRRPVIYAAATVASAVAVVLLWRTLPARAEAKPPAPTPKAAAPAPPLRVTVMTAATAPLIEVISATGTIRATEGVDLQAETNGRVTALTFNEGARVHRGDLLVKLNDADLRATLLRASVRRDLAEAKERRFVKLVQVGNVTTEDYDNARSDLDVQRAEVAIIEAQIAKTEIRAPFDGVIGLRYVSEGAFVNATARIATLQSLDEVKLDFSVPEKYASRIHPGNAVTFTVPGDSTRHQARITAFDPRIDAATRTVLVRAVCPNPGGALLPGGFANVEVTLAEIADAILVPNIAVIPGVSDKNVFVMAGGKAARRAVQTGTRSEESVQITAGLKPGEVVITSGLQQLRPGMAVAIAGAEPAAAKTAAVH